MNSLAVDPGAPSGSMHRYLLLSRKSNKAHGFWLIVGYLGYVTILIGAVMLLPLLALFFYPQEMPYARCFILPGVLTMLAGYVMSLLIRGRQRAKLAHNQDVVVTMFTWIIGIFCCALPMAISELYNFTQAVFETTSALSTNGLSVTDFTNIPRIFLIYRSVLMFVGGIGFLLIMTTFLPSLYNVRLLNAEGHSDRLMPNIRSSAKVIITLYVIYILMGTLGYLILGMNVFDAFNHAVAAISTGGLSTKEAGLGFYNSRLIEMFSVVLMLLGGTSFYVHLLLVSGKFKSALKHCETRMGAVAVLLLSAILAFILVYENGFSPLTAVHSAIFNVVGAMTSTGFLGIDGYDHWTPAAWLILTIATNIGFQAGSTCGGLKLIRVYTALKSISWYVRDHLTNRNVVYDMQINRFGKMESVSYKSQIDNYIFFMLYCFTLLIGTLVFLLNGVPLSDAFLEFSASLAGAGVSVGVTCRDASAAVLWTSIVGMFIGRLEVVVVLFGSLRMIKDVKSKFGDLYGRIRKTT